MDLASLSEGSAWVSIIFCCLPLWNWNGLKEGNEPLDGRTATLAKSHYFNQEIWT